jgi:branched-chain amino acid transport system permease protein
MRTVFFILALAVVLPAIPIGAWREFVLDAAQFAFIITALALSWNIMAATGQLSLAHGAFFGLGGYAAALAANAAVPTPLALLFGAGVAAVSSFLLGITTFRLHGIYFAIATLAFSEVMRTLVNKAQFVGATFGYPVPAAFGGAGGILTAYYVSVALLVVATLVSLALQRSRLHYAFAATRQGEAVARVLGVPAVRMKLIALLISSSLAGLAGGVYGMKTLFLLPPDAFGLHRAIEALVIPIFGGLYTTAGPLVGGLVLVSLENLLRLWAGEGYLVGYGVVLVVAILFMPRGITGVIARVRRGRKEAPGARG